MEEECSNGIINLEKEAYHLPIPECNGGGEGGGEECVRGATPTTPSSPSPVPPSSCVKCSKNELEFQSFNQLKSQYEGEIARLKKEVELATKAKESIVMKYANSEVEVLKLKKGMENSEKLIKSLNNEVENGSKNIKKLSNENTSLLNKIQSLENDRMKVEESMERLQNSNSKHLHQIATLQSELAATECLKVQLQKANDLVAMVQSECQMLKQTNVDLLNDMDTCRAKEVELLAYTQKVTEKNVALQSEYSSMEIKSATLKAENDSLRKQIDILERDILSVEKMMTEESKHMVEEKQTVEMDVQTSKKIISDLQQQLDEARGEIGLLNKKLNSSVREFSKELYVARKQMKDVQGSEELSQSSRTSSCSSLANGDCHPQHSPSSLKPSKQEESSTNHEYCDKEAPVIPDQQVLIERIVKLQRNLAKKQDKIEFLQEHVKQLVESLQKKSKIIQVYAMSQDVEALTSNLAEQNKAEMLKHRGIMASVYGSKSADDAMTLELSLEINRKLQVVLEDTLLRNITLKDSLNTLGKEISKLTESKQDLQNQLLQSK